MIETDPGATLVAMLHAIDRLDWTAVRQSFADRITIDYSDLSGTPAATVGADDLLAQWRALLPGFDATQHLAGPVEFRRDGAAAIVETHVRGYHYVANASGGDTWMVAGHYEARLSERPGHWAIDALTLRVFYQHGNLGLPELARARAAVPSSARFGLDRRRLSTVHSRG